MLVESLINETAEVQVFCVVTAHKTGHGLEAELAADRCSDTDLRLSPFFCLQTANP
ncbi:MAG: hypothetical protein PVI92_09075 [Chromatiales bacterium]|jgi:hypothetical protein